MASANKDTIKFQLYSVKDDTSFRIRNGPGEMQPAYIIGNETSKLLVQAELHTVVHGKNLNSPATLIVISFSFTGNNSERRFRRVQISIRFQDENKRSSQDPEVVGLWPQGDFTLSETERSEEKIDNITVNYSPQIAGIKAGGVAWTRGRHSAHQTKDRTYFVGTKRIEGRNYGKKNAVRLNLLENSTQAPGVVPELYTAILLNRKNDNRFLAHVIVDATADLRYATAQAMGRLLRTIPVNDPVVFDPKKPQDPSHEATFTNIDPKDLAAALRDLGRRILPNMASLRTDHTTPQKDTSGETDPDVREV